MELHHAFFALAMLIVAAAILIPTLCKVIIVALWRPLYIRRAFLNQGIPCLPYRVLLGNLREVVAMIDAAQSGALPQGSHNIVPCILPHYVQWRKQFGDQFVFWLGYDAVLPVSEPEHIREILSNKFGHYQKLVVTPEAKDLAGDSIALLEGEKWAEHRRIVSAAFFVEKLKAMAPTMVACISTTLERWQSQLDCNDNNASRIEIDVHEEYKSLTADVIAHTAFGSSFEEGKLVFNRQREQMVIVAKLGRSIYIPGLSFLPTAHNRYRWRLNKEIKSTLQGIIESRVEDAPANDLLGILLAANRKERSGTQKNLYLNMQEIMDECKTFFFAGHETTANLMTWTTMLLAIHQEWQERTREEVIRVCGKQLPDMESLSSLKLVGMVLNEALRLYPPGAMILRRSVKEMKLGHMSIPPNTLLLMPIIALHHDPKFWGQDALEFNPQRFANGITQACNTPSVFLPFSTGPRNCVGQNFALQEARLILTMILQRFQFSISPGYKHTPVASLTLQPQHGMQIILEKLV